MSNTAAATFVPSIDSNSTNPFINSRAPPRPPVAVASDQSPQQAFTSAVVFTPAEATTQNGTTVGGDPVVTEADKTRMRDMAAQILKNINDSSFVYPGVAMIVASMLLIFVLFGACTKMTKVFAVIVYLMFLAFTVFMHRC